MPTTATRASTRFWSAVRRRIAFLPWDRRWSLPVKLYRGAVARCLRQSCIHRNQGRVERLGERNVGRVVGGKVLSQLPGVGFSAICRISERR